MHASAQASNGTPEGRSSTAFSLTIALAAALALGGCAPDDAGAAAGGDAHAGAVAIARQSCGSCHRISGIAQADGMVGPSLTHFGSRQLIAGRLPNSLDGLRRFLADPQAVSPGTVMPDMGLTERQVRDIAAYLETRK